MASPLFTLRKFFLFSLLFLVGQVMSAATEVDSLVALLKSNPDSTKVRILNALSEKYAERSVEKSIYYADQALLLAKKCNAEADVANAYYNLGKGYYSKVNYSKSLQCYTACQAIFTRLNDQRKIGEVAQSMASVYIDLGNFESALKNNLKSLRIWEELNDSANISSSLLNVGLVYYNLKKMNEAKSYYVRSLRIRDLIHDQAGIAACYNNLANVYSDQGDDASALDYLQKSLEIKEKLGNNKGVAATLNNMGSIYTSRHDFAKAKELYMRSYELKKETGDQLGMALTLGNIGGNYYFMNDKGMAINYFLMAVDVAKKIGAGDVLMNNYVNIAQTQYETGNFRKSSEYYQLAGELKDSLYSVEGLKSMNEMQARFNFEKQERELKISKQKNDIQFLELSQQRMLKNGFIIGFIFLLLIAMIIYNRYQVKQKANAKLEEQKREIVRQHQELNVAYGQIETKNKDITDSIRYAKRLQNAILPMNLFRKTFRENAFIFYKPKDIVSGDFYWMEQVDNTILLAAVDCTGHGVPGAFMSIVGYNILKQAVTEHRLTKPSEILNVLSKGVTETLKQYEEEASVKDGMDICLCSVDLATLQLNYAGAYNPLWIFRKQEFFELKADKLPIGAFVGETIPQFSNQTFQLEKGDMIYLFTDGFADQFGGINGKKFKYKQLQETLMRISAEVPSTQERLLEDVFSKWIGNLEQIDDVLVVGIRI